MGSVSKKVLLRADRLIEPFGLAKVPHAAKLPEIAINLFWHAKYHREPANRWLRAVVVELFGDHARAAAS